MAIPKATHSLAGDRRAARGPSSRAGDGLSVLFTFLRSWAPCPPFVRKLPFAIVLPVARPGPCGRPHVRIAALDGRGELYAVASASRPRSRQAALLPWNR